MKNSTATVDLPSRLGYLVDNLPKGHSLFLDRVIDEHTLLPFYSPFLERDRVARLRRAMEGVGGGAVHKIAAITPSTIRPPDYLKYCPVCVEVDRQDFGECYWHRLHQVPGVRVCPSHKTFLAESGVRARNRFNSYAYISAEQAGLCAEVRRLDQSDDDQQCLMFIAQSAEWLLKQRGLAPGYDVLHGYYMEGFSREGLAYQGRLVHAAKLLEAIRHVYTSYVLDTTQCEFDDNRGYSWPFRLVKDLRLKKANHPLRHLLLIGLLGHTTGSFLRCGSASEVRGDLVTPPSASTLKPSPHRNNRGGGSARESSSAATFIVSTKPKGVRRSKTLFGTGPWPCLNIACSHYRKLVITSCQIIKHWEKRTFDVGVFCCTCGFTYKRNGRDKSPADRFRFDSVVAYGDVWKDRLRKLWGNLTLSIHRMSPLLGVAHSTVKYQAILLGLEFPRKGPGSKAAQSNIKRYPHKSKAKRVKRLKTVKRPPRDRYRREMLRTIEKNPFAIRTQLAKRFARRAYCWLSKYDREWLEAHLPPPVKRVGTTRKVDWAARDVRIVAAVRLAAKRIRSGGGRPVRVTVNRIGQELDKVALLNNRRQRSKLPLTAQALLEIVESHRAFVTRCIHWAVSLYKHEVTVPSVGALAKRAGMTMSTTHRPEIRAVINEALESLRDATNYSEIKAA